MPSGLLFGHDETVASWLFNSYGRAPLKYDKALGILSGEGVIIGAILFHGYNGANVELSYFGKGTMTLGIVRCLARFIIHEFDASRLTAVTSKKRRRLIKSFQKLGWRVEGTQRCYYGKLDNSRNTGVRFVMFREQIEKLAKLDIVQANLEASK